MDGFQYGTNKFHFKAIGMKNVHNRYWQVHWFDTVNLLSHGPAVLHSYRYQSKQHGWLLNSRGLSQSVVKNSLLTFLHDAILYVYENIRPVLVRIVLLVKGKMLVNTVHSGLVATIGSSNPFA